MTLVSILIFVVLGATAIIHIMWGFGMKWPARDDQGLSDMVVGTKGATFMPGLLLTLVVAGGIAAAGVFALWGGGVIALPLPTWMRTASLAVLAAIFLLRGIATYLPFGPLADTVEPFRTLDMRYYAPIILVIGMGYLALLRSVLRAL
jgi:hypothetical protein